MKKYFIFQLLTTVDFLFYIEFVKNFSYSYLLKTVKNNLITFLKKAKTSLDLFDAIFDYKIF
ncbi:hypothetical protein DI487_07075 [Flavobacterium sediminis]|uniref:Uncharacterized protein n=1 Tax=Flavobacterium sediminis TaxID=2201181 RepID=A0A2U8QV24_9FLAO|nr:hypothetical protein DI487_07075 [Flavobacterium sediminis]